METDSQRASSSRRYKMNGPNSSADGRRAAATTATYTTTNTITKPATLVRRQLCRLARHHGSLHVSAPICLIMSIIVGISMLSGPHWSASQASTSGSQQSVADGQVEAALVMQSSSQLVQPQQQQQLQLQQQQPNAIQGNPQMKPSLTVGAGGKQPEILQASSREIEKQIVDKILGEGYDKRIRPTGSGPYNTSRPGSDGPTIVTVNTLVRSISKIDDVTMEYSVQLSLRQEWTDDRLAFGRMAQYKSYGLNSITLTEQERLWKPDLFFRNEKEGHFHKIILPNVLLRIQGGGQVLYSLRISLVLACPMDLKYYPLDKQNCTIEMASYGYLEEDLKFNWKKGDPVQIAKPLNLPRFTLETYNTAYCTSRTTTGAYSCLRIDLIFKREFSYYLIQIYIPCCMLVIVSWVSFWLDPNAIPARVSLGVTTLLTMATQISGINASLPPVSYTKAIDVWTGVCLTFVFGALLEFALVNYASRSDQHKREMLTSALTQTQQMRWREATAAAAAAGVAPPTSPPPDENSPSALAGKHQAFFGPFVPLPGPHCAHLASAPTGYPTSAHQHVLGAPVSLGVDEHYKSTSSRPGTSNGSRGIATVEGNASTFSNTLGRPNGTTGKVNQPSARPSMMANAGQHQMGGSFHLGHNHAHAYHHHNGNHALSSREIHMMTNGRKNQKRKNWCKMWLAKFPTRSKRIDVISRIFFPLKFALFNLVYWTTYLFREEDTVA